MTSRISPYLKLTRFPLVFTAVADSTAAYLLSIGGRPLSPTTLSVLAVTSACLYACGMVLNDLADAVRDRERHPERPIPSGQVSPGQARGFGLGLAVVAIAISSSIHYTLAIGVMVTFLVIMAYDFVTKEWSAVGAATMGMARFCNFGLGILAAGLRPGDLWILPPGPWREAMILGVYVFCLTRVSQSEERAGSVWELAFGGTSMALVAAAAWWRSPERWPWATVSAGFLVVLVLGLMAAALAAPGKGSVMRLVLWGVIGIILLDATLVLGQGMVERGAAIAGLLIPVMISRPVFRHL